jgi:hypothetical protein
VSNQTTTHHRGHPGVNRLTHLCRGRWKKHRTKYLYDANGNVTNLWSSASGGVSNVYQYDALNRLTNVLANGSAIAGYNFVPLAIFRQCATVTASPIFTNTINLIG